MYFLDTDKTQKYDILLTTTSKLQSRVIRFATGSDISHASLLVDQHVLIDSTGDGVHSRNIHRIEYEDKCSIHLMRLKEHLRQDQMIAIEGFVRDKIGTRYNTLEAIKSGLVQRGIMLPKKDEYRMFCSRLVAEAYNSAGIKLVENPSYCTPEDLKNSPFLYEVNDVSKIIPNEFFISVNSEGQNFDKKMRDVTNALLSKVRKMNDKVETLTDVILFLLEHPDKDGEVLAAYQESGYLTLEDEIFNSTPYLYDEACFMVFYKTEFYNRAKEGLKEDTSRFENNLAIYKDLYKERGLKTFDALVMLYKKLVDHACLRKKTCNEVIKNLAKKAPTLKMMFDKKIF